MPEPASLMLMGLALTAVLFRLRRVVRPKIVVRLEIGANVVRLEIGANIVAYRSGRTSS